ncbi:DUF6929 family protein [Roseateles toxinivorans]|uniref:Uncharacterized protein n=1 Tax=Roseateles toxinivorans TaxID=270368 RepID=A0A4R6QQ67_9BURK|nr:hypothetical protein [Roseateles toxinivorans]TDP72275.1 hypothetical protein DES47_10220 [Roseateles toxinivorans]
MLNVQVLRTLLVETESGRVHLSAASGLIQIGHRLYVIADDENMLGVFSLEGDQEGTLVRLFGGELPSAPKARKAAKPDLEALALLPAFSGYPHGALLALGSGSRKQRQRAALLALDSAGELDGTVREVDLSLLYASLHVRHEQLNIEGAFVSEGTFCLLQRGNEATPINALLSFDWASTQNWLCGVGPAPQPVSTTQYDLGDIDGVPLCFTDGSALPDGGWVFCAAAEATFDNYADGPCRGSAVGVVAANGELRTVLPLSLRCKAEGIAVNVENGLLQLRMVTDADDPDTPALLLGATLESPSA